MKKEVIYFDAGAFGPFAKCELEDEYLVSDVNNFNSENNKISSKKIKLDNFKLDNFWKRIDELNVWNWNKRYEDEMAMTDGYTWEIKLRNRDGKSKYSSGYEKFPKTFKKFVDELNKLFETKIDYWD